ncbi:SNF2-related protein [Fimbriiglobus ruber]|uniref:SWF/SNF family helicase n=1 Tax=Fimbriiglobus ruber TaxID=1908690 RepID=A0A225DND2_9BACT|nr:SNF2-related protein [Fimbriiglobus ruber]OWK42980.1 SWF/SNF family helicase [Fimbriiglobus ruber]
MTLATNLAPQVPVTIRDQGATLLRAGAVTLDSVSSVDVYASVKDRGTCDVDLYLEGRLIYASCTCQQVDTYGMTCKHIWATILAAEGRGFVSPALRLGYLRLVIEGGDEPEDVYPEDTYPVYSPPVPQRPAPPVPARENWKAQLDSLQQQFKSTTTSYPRRTLPAERQLAYIIDVPTSTQSQRLTLDLAARELKKNGEWGQPRQQGVSTQDIDTLPDPLDRQLMTLLGGAERSDQYSGFYSSGYGSTTRYRLSAAMVAAALPLLAKTGRVRLRTDPKRNSPSDVVTADDGPPWQLAVTINRNDKGTHWVLAGRLQRDNETMDLSTTKLMVPGVVFWADRFAALDDDGAFSWVPLLRKVGSISVPVAKADELLGHLLQMPKLPRLDLPNELKYTEEKASPKPRLVVKAHKPQWGAQVLHGELSFVYEGQTVPSQPPARGIFQPDGKRLLLRDPEAEQAAAQKLTRLGFRPGYSYGSDPHKLELRPDQLPKAVRELVSAGWQIEAEGKLYRQPGAFTLAVHSENDWFDLEAAADFDGHAVPLPRLLEAMRRGENTVVLDDGSMGMVPEEWLKKYGLLARLGTVEGDKVRFARAQVGLLDALLASRPEVTFDKQFAKARDELKKFVGVAAVDPPKGFKGELREYQREGLGWLRFLRRFGFGGCLADDMGLGKTVQVLAYLAGLRKTAPSLVVVPRSLVFNWKQEAAKFAPNLRVLDHTGTERDRTGAAFKDYDLIVTTYGTLRNDATVFSEFRFDTCVLDESQAAKNSETETAKAVRLIRADHRLALSGTPVENHLGELWSLFEFLNPGMLGQAALFGSTTSAGRTLPVETRELLTRALRPYILRRTKDQVAKDLPAKTEQTLYCDLEPAQRKLYDELRDHYRHSLLARVSEVGINRAKIQVLEALLRLRQAACHPGLLDKQRLAEGSAKLDVLLPQLRELAEEGHKALVFSQFTSLLSIVKQRLDKDGVTYEYLDGKTRDRQARVDRFQTDPTCKLFLISLKAGGVGLNLTAAEYVFLLDPWWNPAVEAQAIDRSHRIGQTRPVFAYRLIARDTVEEKVLALQQSKRELADAILGGDGRLITDLKREDLELLLS